MTKDEIIEYASRYVDADEIVDFPAEGDLFCFMHRPIAGPVKKNAANDGWIFGGYGILDRYELDLEAKPVGKWIVVHYSHLVDFPVRKGTLQLQPPHVAKGYFQSPDRTMETKLVRYVSSKPVQHDLETESEGAKILSFPGRKK